MGFLISKRKLLAAIKETEMIKNPKPRRKRKINILGLNKIGKLKRLAYLDQKTRKYSDSRALKPKLIGKKRPVTVAHGKGYKVKVRGKMVASFDNRADAIAYAKFCHRKYHCAVSVEK